MNPSRRSPRSPAVLVGCLLALLGSLFWAPRNPTPPGPVGPVSPTITTSSPAPEESADQTLPPPAPVPTPAAETAAGFEPVAAVAAPTPSGTPRGPIRLGPTSTLGSAPAPSSPSPSTGTSPALTEQDQHSIAGQIQAARRWFAATVWDGRPAWVATVEEQGFHFIADAQGVEVRAAGGDDWHWRLRPTGTPLGTPQAERERVSYDRGQGVTEWFSNGEQGIEHGFTLATASQSPTRRMELRLETGLQPVLRPERDGIDFTDATGLTQLHYDGLYAHDATGRGLTAWMEVSGEKLTLAVNTEGAQYPVTIDPVISLAARTFTGIGQDSLGAAIAQHGDWVAFGAPTRDTGDVRSQGSVYLLRRVKDCEFNWTLHTELKVVPPPPGPDPFSVKEFGQQVALGERTLAVTLQYSDGPILRRGVRIYRLDPSGNGTWSPGPLLEEPATGLGNLLTEYGQALAVSPDGTQVAVGAPAARFNGELGQPASGRVYRYHRDTPSLNAWGLVQTVQPPSAAEGARFGSALGLNDDLLAVAAPGLLKGRVFVYSGLPAATWAMEKEFAPPAVNAPETIEGFGKSLSLHGNWLAIGAPESDAAQQPDVGRVILAERRALKDAAFQTTSYLWFTGILRPASGARFGRHVSLANGLLTISSHVKRFLPEDAAPTLHVYRQRETEGIDPTTAWRAERTFSGEMMGLKGFSAMLQTDDAVFVGSRTEQKIVAMRQSAASWIAQFQFNEGSPADAFGSTLVQDGDLLAVGAPQESNGSGAVYVFRRKVTSSGQEWSLTWTYRDAVPRTGRIAAALALRDDRLLVGVPGLSGGLVWVYDRENAAASNWKLSAVLLPPSDFPAVAFGSALAYNTQFAVVGDPGANGGRGGAVVYEVKPGPLWPVAMGGTAAAPHRGYGASVAMTDSGDYLVGAPQTPVPSDLIPLTNGGSAFVWRYQPQAQLVGGFFVPLHAWVVEQHLFPTGPASEQSGGRFGTSVAFRGHWALIGAPGDGQSRQAGTVYAFRRDRNVTGPPSEHLPWRLSEKLTVPEAGKGAVRFGASVALGTTHAAVGAPGSLSQRGQVFLYRNTPGQADWTFQARLLSPCTASGDAFGTALAVSLDEVVVGAPGTGVTLFEQPRQRWRLWREVPPSTVLHHGSLAVGSALAINGDWLVVGAPAYVATYLDKDRPGLTDTATTSPLQPFYVLHRRNPGGTSAAWETTTVIGVAGSSSFAAGNNQNLYLAGASVAISGHYVLIGTPNLHPERHGVAQMVRLNSEGRAEILGLQILGAPEGSHLFGTQVALSGNLAAVAAAAAYDDQGQSLPTGKVHLYQLNGDTFTQQVTSHGVAWSRFKTLSEEHAFGYGSALALQGSRLMVGADRDFGIAGRSPGTGVVFYYEQDQDGKDQWGLVKQIGHPSLYADETQELRFGAALALDGDTLVVGIAGDAVNGNQYGTGGAAMVFERHAGGFNAWGAVATLTTSNSVGVSVAISGPLIAVGGPGGTFDIVDEFGFPEGEEDVPGTVSLFHRDAPNLDAFPDGGISINPSAPPHSSGWGRVATFRPLQPDRKDTWSYGAAVALNGTTLAVGAPGQYLWRRVPYPPDSEHAGFDRIEDISRTKGLAFVYDLATDSAQRWIDRWLPDTVATGVSLPGDQTPYSGTGNPEPLDFDHDGLTSSLERFHGLNPFLADAAKAALTSGVSAGPNGEFILRWREGFETGLQAKVQWSDTLGDWFDSGAGPTPDKIRNFTITTVATEADHVIREARVTAGNSEGLFVRLSIQP
jgi:hypothetical protein